MEAVRGIGFDLDHTLAIDNRLERVAFLHLLELVEARGGRALGTLGDEIDAIDALLHRQRCAELTLDEAVESFAVARGARAGEGYAQWFRAKVLSMVPEFVIALPNVRTTVDALRDRAIPMAVLTNGWNPLQLRKAERTGFTGPVLVSGDIGERKPGVGAFEQLLARLGTPRAQTWYVGDDPHGDIAGAHGAGMPAVWINWERKEFPADLRPPERTITGFEELLALIPEVAPTP
ncbi:MAG TPA: HAD family hydrolase [Candidatus Cybelea sp.]|jgi:HAD superfamily hydrolase (TIGR01509 family)|nr:HAD family hydrolase [Candidatus Cybelea sp.]